MGYRVVFSFLFFIFTVHSASADQKVIYGTDDRKDLFEISDQQVRLAAESTVVLIAKSNLQSNQSGEILLPTATFQQEMRMCSDEPFANQPSPGFCSGTLIANNRILTAGHCIENATDCADAAFLFGFAVNSAGQFPRKTTSDQVYSCKRIIHHKLENKGADYAIIELDRTVPDHQPLPVAKRSARNEITKGTDLVLIGYPAGLPVKIAAGASVRSAMPTGYFVADTDSYGGNSGSAVFNAVTMEIEGVLVRGEADYVTSSAGCRKSNICTQSGCRGEDVTKASAFNFLP